MNATIKVAAFIPVRGGSKSIPHKNIKLFCGKPLVYWTVKAASECSLIDAIYVATDSEAIRTEVEGFGLPKVFLFARSASTATDTASTESAMLEFTEQIECEQVVLIQATSPLLESEDLQRGLELYYKEAYDSLLSGVEQKRFIWIKNTDGDVQPRNYIPTKRPRRQEMDGYFIENGAFYITTRERLIETQSRLSGRIGLYPMLEDTYFEIDEPGDWIIAETLKWNRIIAHKKTQDKEIRLLVCDVDGVLTDAGMYYNIFDDELKKFNTRDGKGFEILRNFGIKIMLMTSENISIVKRRAEKLQVDYLFMGIKDKKNCLERFYQANSSFSKETTAYIGDDINDLEAMRGVAFSATPQDGVQEVKRIADYICTCKGGEGCVREVCDLIAKFLRT